MIRCNNRVDVALLCWMVAPCEFVFRRFCVFLLFSSPSIINHYFDITVNYQNLAIESSVQYSSVRGVRYFEFGNSCTCG